MYSYSIQSGKIYSYSSYLNVFLFQGLEFKCIRISGETVTTPYYRRVVYTKLTRKSYHGTNPPNMDWTFFFVSRSAGNLFFLISGCDSHTKTLQWRMAYRCVCLLLPFIYQSNLSCPSRAVQCIFMKSMDGRWDENQVRSCGGATWSSQYNLLKKIIKHDMLFILRG